MQTFIGPLLFLYYVDFLESAPSTQKSEHAT